MIHWMLIILLMLISCIIMLIIIIIVILKVNNNWISFIRKLLELQKKYIQLLNGYRKIIHIFMFISKKLIIIIIIINQIKIIHQTITRITHQCLLITQTQHSNTWKLNNPNLIHLLLQIAPQISWNHCYKNYNYTQKSYCN